MVLLGVCVFKVQYPSWKLEPILSLLYLQCRAFRFLLCPRENNSVPGWDALEGGKVRSWKVELVFLPVRFGDGDF